MNARTWGEGLGGMMGCVVIGSALVATACCLGGGGDEGASPTATGGGPPTSEAQTPPTPPEDGPPADAPSFIRQAGALATRGNCDYYTRCCTDAERSADTMLDAVIGASCAFAAADGLGALVGGPSTAEQTQQGLLDAVTAGRVRYDAAVGASCIAALRTATPPVLAACSGNDPRGGLRSPTYAETTACRGVFVGTLADDAECTIPEECVSRHCDMPDLSSPAMHCMRAYAYEGEACGGDGPSCISPLHCTDDGHCAPPSPVGASCDNTDFEACAQPLYCRTSGDDTQGTCTARVAGGAACSDDGECVSTHCDDGHCRTVCVGTAAPAP